MVYGMVCPAHEARGCLFSPSQPAPAPSGLWKAPVGSSLGLRWGQGGRQEPIAARVLGEGKKSALGPGPKKKRADFKNEIGPRQAIARS